MADVDAAPLDQEVARFFDRLAKIDRYLAATAVLRLRVIERCSARQRTSPAAENRAMILAQAGEPAAALNCTAGCRADTRRRPTTANSTGTRNAEQRKGTGDKIMHPRLLTTPFLTVHTFGVLLATAYGAAFWWLMREGRRERVDVDALSSLAFWAIAGAIIGAKALMVARDVPEYVSNPIAAFSLSLLTSAGDFYGGFIGALIASALYFRRHRRVPFWPTADMCGPAIALGQAIGRIGCLMAGDDFGRPTQMPWAVTFTDPDAASIGGAPLGVPLHPVQAYESIVCVVLFIGLIRLLRRKRFDGEVVLAYTALYAIARFVLEFFRGDADRGLVVGWVSTSQFIAAILGPAAIALLVSKGHRSRRVARGKAIER